MAPVKCPKCRSEQLTANKKGFGLKKAVVGGVALGGVGLLGGFIGSGKVKITCLACGHEWIAGKVRKRKRPKNQMESPGEVVTSLILLALVFLALKACGIF